MDEDEGDDDDGARWAKGPTRRKKEDLQWGRGTWRDGGTRATCEGQADEAAAHHGLDVLLVTRCTSLIPPTRITITDRHK